MTLISLVLMTVWMIGIILGFTMGGLVHVLALSAVTIVFMSGNRRELRPARSRSRVSFRIGPLRPR